MVDWGPVVVSVVLFVLLSPGLLLTIPGHNRAVEFGAMNTRATAIIIHALLFFALLTLFLIALRLHIYAAQ